jgi:hypothetical protein
VLPLPPARLSVHGPEAVIVGEAADLLVNVQDITGRGVLGVPVVVTSDDIVAQVRTELDPGTQRLIVHVPRRRPSDGRLHVRLKAAQTPVEGIWDAAVSSGPATRVTLSATPGREATLLKAEVFDAFGNAVDEGLHWSATAGIAEAVGPREARWRPRDAEVSESGAVTAEVTSVQVSTSTHVAYQAPHARLGLSMNLGYETDVGRLGGPGTRVELSYGPPSWPEQLSLALRGGASRSSDALDVSVGGAAGSLERQAWLAPLLIGLEYSTWLGALRLHAGAAPGALMAATRASLHLRGRLVNTARWQAGFGTLLEAWTDVGLALPAGELRLGLAGWQTLSAPTGFRDRPHAVVTTLGYALFSE